MTYTIKNNLPGIIPILEDNTDTILAKETFFKILDILRLMHPVKVFFRDDHKKPMRGQIQVEIDGFYYYVELYRTEGK